MFNEGSAFLLTRCNMTVTSNESGRTREAHYNRHPVAHQTPLGNERTPDGASSLWKQAQKTQYLLGDICLPKFPRSFRTGQVSVDSAAQTSFLPSRKTPSPPTQSTSPMNCIPIWSRCLVWTTHLADPIWPSCL